MKILIVNNNMEIGGIQKALSNLLEEISEKHSVTLMLFNKQGGLIDDIPKSVKIIEGNFFTRIIGMTQADAKKSGFLTFLWRSAWVVATRVLGTKFSFGLLSKMQKLNEEYDAAVSYMQNSSDKFFYGGCNEFVLNGVKAKKKISFVHCDFMDYEGNNLYNRSLYEKFDAIACVSDSCKKKFLAVCPEVKDKTYTVYNVHGFRKMDLLADEYAVEKPDGKMIFTSARISEEKGIMRVIPALGRIKKDGGNFVWYIAGDGPLMEKAREEANSCGVEKDIVFLGMKSNPYPYFKNADVLLVPSYNEAAPMVFGEAIHFGTPVITTETSSAKELCEGYGVITENTDDAIEKALREFILENKEIKISAGELTNERALEEFEKILW